MTNTTEKCEHGVESSGGLSAIDQCTDCMCDSLQRRLAGTIKQLADAFSAYDALARESRKDREDNVRLTAALDSLIRARAIDHGERGAAQGSGGRVAE